MALTIGQVARAADVMRPTDDCPILEALEDHGVARQ